jgi:hypothetical protein
MKALPEAGADVIELGMPFSDPMADGPAIQACRAAGAEGRPDAVRRSRWRANSARRATTNADRHDGLLQPDLHLRRRALPGRRQGAGIDGLIVVDLPPEMDEELCIPARRRDINFIRLATPTTDDKRLPKVLENTSGFVYYVSMTGITGSALPIPRGSPARSSASRPHRPAGLRRLRRQDRRAGAPDRRRPMASWSARRSSIRPTPRCRRAMEMRRSGRGRCHAGARSGAAACGLRALLPPNSFPIWALNIRRPSRAMNWITNYVRPKINSMLGRRECRRTSGSSAPRRARWSSTRTWRRTSGSSRPPAIT